MYLPLSPRCLWTEETWSTAVKGRKEELTVTVEGQCMLHKARRHHAGVLSLLLGELTKSGTTGGGRFPCLKPSKPWEVSEFYEAAALGEVGDGAGNRKGMETSKWRQSEPGVDSGLFIRLPPVHWPPNPDCCACLPPWAVQALSRLLEGLPTHALRGLTWATPADLCDTPVFNGGPRPGACWKWALKGVSLVLTAAHTKDSKLQAENSLHLCKTWIYLDKGRWRGWVISLHFSTLHSIEKKWNIALCIFFPSAFSCLSSEFFINIMNSSSLPLSSISLYS